MEEAGLFFFFLSCKSKVQGLVSFCIRLWCLDERFSFPVLFYLRKLG